MNPLNTENSDRARPLSTREINELVNAACNDGFEAEALRQVLAAAGPERKQHVLSRIAAKLKPGPPEDWEESEGIQESSPALDAVIKRMDVWYKAYVHEQRQAEAEHSTER